MAISGETSVEPASKLLSRMVNSCGSPSGGGAHACTSTDCTAAMGGGEDESVSKKRVNASCGPDNSPSRPEEVLRTQPRRPCRRTRRCTKGRKPTPWTMPLTLTEALVSDTPLPKRDISPRYARL